MYEIIKNYKDNNKLRHSFNELAKTTFGLDFEDWYQNGYWRENYIPYSIVQNENIIANVSVNLTNMLWDGIQKHIIQLGTIMTENAFRNQGFIRRIMEEIENDKLILYSIFTESDIELDDVIRTFGNSIKKVELRFVPCKKSEYVIAKLQEEDTTLFVKGRAFDDFNKKRLMLPTLAHA